MAGQEVPVAETPPAVSVAAVPKIETLKNRPDFLAVARAARSGQQGLLLQARKRPSTDKSNPQVIRVGYTCSKKIGNSVIRNRAKRRLREVARICLPRLGETGWDYVLVGRPRATVNRGFSELLIDLETALRKIHQ